MAERKPRGRATAKPPAKRPPRKKQEQLTEEVPQYEEHNEQVEGSGEVSSYHPPVAAPLLSTKTVILIALAIAGMVAVFFAFRGSPRDREAEKESKVQMDSLKREEERMLEVLENKQRYEEQVRKNDSILEVLQDYNERIERYERSKRDFREHLNTNEKKRKDNEKKIDNRSDGDLIDDINREYGQ